ncbi:MAG: archaemetzincin family Zn-dependent metalloprotease [Syntrophobacteraceae bacterium]
MKIRLIALDFRDEQVIGRLGRELEALFHAHVGIMHREFDSYAFLDFERNQFNSCAILRWLEDDLRRNGTGQTAMKSLAVTARDLCTPMLTFVFGEARLESGCAVVSSCRLRNEYYGLPNDPVLFSERLLKECVHELCHTFGLVHCNHPECVMKSSTCVEQIDLKTSRFCDRCRNELSIRTGARPG